MRGVYWHNIEISGSQIGVCYVELLHELVVGKSVLSLRLTMHCNVNMYGDSGVVLNNLSLDK
jgi:hypothetical protein